MAALPGHWVEVSLKKTDCTVDHVKIHLKGSEDMPLPGNKRREGGRGLKCIIHAHPPVYRSGY